MNMEQRTRSGDAGDEGGLTRLGDVARIKMGQSPPGSFVAELRDGAGMPFLQGNGEFGPTHPAPRLACSRPQRTCAPGDVLISVRAPVGAVNVADRAYCIGRGLGAVRFVEVLPRYGAHALRFSSSSLQRVAQGTTFGAVGRRELEALVLWRPPVDEQRRIAEILDTLDEAIRKTEQLLGKLSQVKQGLLVDLLTRGVDEDGELRRPPRELRTRGGRPLPKAWVMGGILDVAPPDRQAIVTGPFGAQLCSSDFVAAGVPLLRIGNVQWGYLDLSDLLYVSSAKAASLDRYRVRRGDLLFARQGATTGRNALADERVEGHLINYHLIRVATDPGRCDPIYLHAAINSEDVQRQVNREKGRSTREGVSTATLAAFRFPLPPIDEQRRIAAVLVAHNNRAQAEEAKIQKLSLLKRGLMEDLLTGRVRALPAGAP